MPRPVLHHPDVLLDHARAIVLERGLRAATMDAIAEASGAPTGSLYYRFRSRDDLLARLWIRAVRRSQEAFCAAEQRAGAEAAAIAAALSLYDFCEQQREDARLLVSIRREDLIQSEVSPELRRELQELNRPIERTIASLSRRLFGGASAADRDRVTAAVFDIPYGLARRLVHRDGPFPMHRRAQLIAAVRGAVRAGRQGGPP